MKKMMFLSKNWYFSVQKVLIDYTVNKSHHNSFILLVFSHVANFRYVANFRFLTLFNLILGLFLIFQNLSSQTENDLSMFLSENITLINVTLPYLVKKFTNILYT